MVRFEVGVERVLLFLAGLFYVFLFMVSCCWRVERPGRVGSNALCSTSYVQVPRGRGDGRSPGNGEAQCVVGFHLSFGAVGALRGRNGFACDSVSAGSGWITLHQML